MLAFVFALGLSCSLFAQTIEDRLQSIDGIVFRPVSPVAPGYQSFQIFLEQYEDHTRPEAKTFPQALILHHKSFAAPMVLQTSGYAIFRSGLAEIAAKFSANQIQVEHRFFDGSIAKDPDWTKMNIWQSATDFHRITQIFKKIYQGTWVNTGASKGGMTSVFHRRYYPEDLDVTVAYVAPISYGTADPRYISFLESVGGDEYATCRAKLISAQRGLLKHREALLASVRGDYSQLTSASVAFEHAVYEMPFAFWQYSNPSLCDQVPLESSSPGTLWSFLSMVNDVRDSYSDEGMDPFIPYYFQAAQQLGAPGNSTKEYDDLAIHQTTYDIKNYVGSRPLAAFDESAMQHIQRWVLEKGRRIIFINGEYDPWSAAAYQFNADREQRTYVAPGANHGAKISSLINEEQQEAWNLIRSWLKVPEESVAKTIPSRSLEDEEFEARRRLR